MGKKIIAAVSEGLVHTLPIILAGSVALVLESLPIGAYQEFLENFLGGALKDFLATAYGASLGIFGILLAMSVSYSYAGQAQLQAPFMVSAASLCAYFIMMGLDSFSLDQAGGQTVFVALLASVLSSLCFQADSRRASRGDYGGMGPALRESMRCIRPFGATLLLFTLLKVGMVALFGDRSVQDILSDGVCALYRGMGANLGSCAFFLLSVHLLWLCGIHGNNVLHSVSDALFEPGVGQNMAQIGAGLAPTHIFSKTFIDSFVIIGGCGASLSLIAALFLFGRKQNLKQIAKVSLLPGIFNVNEMLVFGIPIVLNPAFLVPFLLVPMINLILSYLATLIGFLPVVTTQVEWTTPALLSGYLATGSVRGAIFQVFLMAVGVLVYRPFVLRYEASVTEKLKGHVGELTRLFQENEEEGGHPTYVSMAGELGGIAKMLAGEFQTALGRRQVSMFYQPQVDRAGKCIGAEALLRWDCPDVGYVYPPLLVELAKECGILGELDRFVAQEAGSFLKRLNGTYSENLKISINITGASLRDPGLIPMLEETVEACGVPRRNFWIEVTEQDAIASTEEALGRLEKLSGLGYHLLIDDFGMGHTSLTYLKASYFKKVKLDGSLTREYQNERYQEIIASITQLSRSLDFDVIAEYVETEEQQEKLRGLGCTAFQGYLYSKAVPGWELERWLDGRETV